MAHPTKLLCAFIATSLCAGVSASFVSVPLVQSQGERASPIQHIQHAAHKYGAANKKSVPTVLDGGFWFTGADVANAKGLKLLIDTGSYDVGVNPGKYKPSSSSKKLGAGGDYRYITTLEDGCGTSNISYQGYSDKVCLAGLEIENGLYAVRKQPASPGTITQLPNGDGIVGFSSTESDEFGVPFFWNLCKQKKLKECRFGLAFKTDGTGRQVLGGIDSSAYTGPLTRVPTDTRWGANADVVYEGKTLIRNISMVFDSGTAGIVAPVKHVKAYFKAAGIQAVDVNLPGCYGGVFGYYDCRKPPNLGFRFSPQGPVFDIEPSAMKLANNGGNNCTVWVTGLSDNELGESFFILGQNFFQGKFLDFSLAATTGTVGIAPLKKK